MARDGVGRNALFDDPYTDARLRRLIPRLAALGLVAYTFVGAAVARTAREVATLGTLMAATLLLTWTINRRNLLSRVPRRVVFVVLLAYAAAISVSASPSPAMHLLDEVLRVVAVLFAAVFFAGWARYGAAGAVAVLAHVMLDAAGRGSWPELLAHVVGYQLVGYFGGEVADTLRESLRAQQAVHSVLAVARRDLPDDDIAAAGLTAALSVSGWDAGSVALVDGEFLRAGAIQGLPGEVVAWHGEQPRLRVDGPGLSAAVVRSGEPQYIANANELLGAEQAVITWGASCLAGVPIRYRGEVLGSLNLVDRQRRSFAPGERERVEAVAEQLGLALGSARAYRREAAVAAGLLDLNRRKDEFLANVSHELRTPATSLGLAARTLHAGRGRLTDEQEERIIEMMRRRSAELTGLIEGLLAEAIAVNGQTRLEIQPVDWTDSLPRWAAAATEATMRQVTVEAPDGPLVTFSDPAKCERIVMNLLSNAAKFSDPDTPIACRVAGVGDCVEVSVTDHGIGIPDSVLPRVFDRFFQADGSMTRAHGGLGIGLSLVRHFAEAHGGTVEVASTEGVGTTVTVTLPRNIRPLRAVVPA